MSTPQEIFQRYLMAGAMQRDANQVAELFAEDGVYEAPLVPPGLPFPHRLEGREEIRRGLGAFYQLSQKPTGAIDPERSRLVVHRPEPDVLIAELDSAFVGAQSVSLVQIFRFRDGLITSLRDYFHPDVV